MMQQSNQTGGSGPAPTVLVLTLLPPPPPPLGLVTPTRPPEENSRIDPA
jgi:hypothetical protein